MDTENRIYTALGLSLAVSLPLGVWLTNNQDLAHQNAQERAVHETSPVPAAVSLQEIIKSYGGSEKTGQPIDSLGTQIKYDGNGARFEFHKGLTNQPNATLVFKCIGKAMSTEFIPKSLGKENAPLMADYPPCEDGRISPADQLVQRNPAFVTPLGVIAIAK